MTTEARLTKIITATPDTLRKIDRILTGEATETEPGDRKLLTLTDAAKTLGVSRQTVWRMINDGRLPTIEMRAGRCRVPSSALTALLKGGVA